MEEIILLQMDITLLLQFWTISRASKSETFMDHETAPYYDTFLTTSLLHIFMNQESEHLEIGKFSM